MPQVRLLVKKVEQLSKEKERLEYFASPEGRDDARRYGAGEPPPAAGPSAAKPRSRRSCLCVRVEMESETSVRVWCSQGEPQQQWLRALLARHTHTYFARAKSSTTTTPAPRSTRLKVSLTHNRINHVLTIHTLKQEGVQEREDI